MTALTKQTDKFAETQIDDEHVLMLLDTGEFLSLAGTGGEIWRLIDGTRDRAAILAELGREFDAPEAELAGDLDAFLAALREASLVA